MRVGVGVAWRCGLCCCWALVKFVGCWLVLLLAGGVGCRSCIMFVGDDPVGLFGAGALAPLFVRLFADRLTRACSRTCAASCAVFARSLAFNGDWCTLVCDCACDIGFQYVEPGSRCVMNENVEP